MILSAGVADAANAPPALVTKENVALLDVLPATRSVIAMENAAFPTAVLAATFANCDNSTAAKHTSSCLIDILNIECCSKQVTQ